MKGGNTFRFLKYRDEIKKKVVVSFKTNCFDDDNNLDSYFASAVEKWTDSSSSEQFLTFRRKISPYVLSLKLIIFHQDLICRELKVFWEQLDDACLPPALDLIANLACDIREDFFNHIDDFLPLVVGAIIRNAKNAELLSHCFNCLSHLVYFLHRPMVKNIQQTIKYFLPVISHHSTDIPRFSAECLAFLFRKFHDKIGLLHILDKMIENPECLGVVLVELLLGVGEKVHATSLEVLPRLLDSIFSSNCGNKQHPHLIYDDCEGKNQILSSYNTTSKLGISSKDLSIDPKILTAVSYSLSQLAKRNPSAEQISYVIQHLTLQCQCLSTENSQYFSEYVSLLTSFLQSIAQSDFMPLFEENISQILTILTNCYSSRDVINLCCLFLQSTSGRYNPYHFIKSVIQNKTQETEGRFEFLKELAKYPKFDKELSPNLIHLLLDIYSQRTSNSISSQSFCVFDSVFRIALIKQLISDEPNTYIKPLPVEITLNLLIGAIKQLADDIHCSNESNIGTFFSYFMFVH
ncbi:small subunit processome component 20 like [Schistosoma japonicum]|nr:small subunit processome component 20 like [Schistosoma japonicum]